MVLYKTKYPLGLRRGYILIFTDQDLIAYQINAFQHGMMNALMVQILRI